MTAANATDEQLLNSSRSAKFAAIASFRLADYLKLGTMIGSTRVTYVGPNFLKHFGDVEESNIPAAELKIYTLQSWTLDQRFCRRLASAMTRIPISLT